MTIGQLWKTRTIRILKIRNSINFKKIRRYLWRLFVQLLRSLHRKVKWRVKCLRWLYNMALHLHLLFSFIYIICMVLKKIFYLCNFNNNINTRNNILSSFLIFIKTKYLFKAWWKMVPKNKKNKSWSLCPLKNDWVANYLK